MTNNIKVDNQWKNLLDVDVLKNSIAVISLFIMVYELLEDSIISKPKDYYTIIEYDKKAQQEYKEKVLSLYDKDAYHELPSNRRDLISSLIWFKNFGAIDDVDIQIFAKSKCLRNKLTHEMLPSIADGAEKIVEQFAQMYDLFCKIEKWWIVEYEIPIDPDIPELSNDDKNNVLSGNMIVLEVIMDILANNSNANFIDVCKSIGVKVK